MSTLHEAARRVVAAWASKEWNWVMECNAAVLALDAALKAQPEPARKPEPVSVDQRVMPLMESALQAVAEKIGDQCAVWYGIGARDVEAVLREAARYGLVRTAQSEPAQEPFSIRDLLTQAAAMAVASERAGKYEGASWVADAVLEAAPQPQQGPVAAAFSAAFGAEQHSTDQRIVIERRGETLHLNGQEIGPGTLEIRRDGVTYRAAERVAVKPEPAQEPAGIVRVDAGEVHIVPTTRDADVSPLKDGQAVYATPPKPEPAQEPLVWESVARDLPALTQREYDALHKDLRWNYKKITPPRRPPLTDEEIAAEWRKASECAGKSEGVVTGSQFIQIFARAIERKVRGE